MLLLITDQQILDALWLCNSLAVIVLKIIMPYELEARYPAGFCYASAGIRSHRLIDVPIALYTQYIFDDFVVVRSKHEGITAVP